MKMSNVKISVIIPVYNAERYLRECLDSVLCQTLSAFEVILVDDGSTDSSLEIMRQYAAEDDRIRIIIQKDRQYAGVARNRGMQEANGKYLLFLDADDIFDARMFGRLYEQAEKRNAQVTVCRAEAMEKGKTVDMPWALREEYLPDKSVFSYRDLGVYLFLFAAGWAWDKLFLREFIQQKQIQFSGTKIINDRKFVYTALAEAERITVLEERLVRYRRGEKSSLSYERENCCEDVLTVMMQLEQELSDRGRFEELQRAYVNQALQFCFSFSFSLGEEAQRKFYRLLRQEYLNRNIFMHDASYYLYANDYRRLEMLREENEVFTDAFWLRYLFPAISIPQGSRVIVYGAGKIGVHFVRELKKGTDFELVLWTDRNYVLKCQEGLAVEDPEQIKAVKFDYLLIAIEDVRTSKQIEHMLTEWGVEREKIVQMNEEQASE